jgi:hypothetical protein
MQIKSRRTSLPRPSDRSSAASRLIANIFQGTDVVPRGRDNPFKAPRTIPTIPYADRFWLIQILATDPAGNQYT